jgi:hypothetical protein
LINLLAVTLFVAVFCAVGRAIGTKHVTDLATALFSAAFLAGPSLVCLIACLAPCRKPDTRAKLAFGLTALLLLPLSLFTVVTWTFNGLALLSWSIVPWWIPQICLATLAFFLRLAKDYG